MNKFLVPQCLVLMALFVGVGFRVYGEELTGPRTFTDVDGRSLKAEIVSLSDDQIGMKRYPEGVEFLLPLNRLSGADRAFLADNKEEIVKRVTPLPETEFTRLLRKDFRVIKQSGIGMESVPPRLWMKTRYFLIVYGLEDSPEITGGLVKYIGDEISERFEGKPVAVIWLGPSNRNGTTPPPIPEGDLKVAKRLPPGVAVVNVEAVSRDGALVDAEIAAIASDESPGKPELFLASNYRDRPEAVRMVWRKRILARIPMYWPGCVYRTAFDRRTTNGAIQAFLVDREGHQVMVNGIPLEGFFHDVAGYADKLLAREH